jgi:uncharacterized protein YaeQ
MSLKATIYKANLQITDLDRRYFKPHDVTVACHPSETEERMMVRILAFILHAHERLEFGKGLSDDDEPALWRKSLSGEIEVWIELGQPSEDRIRKACQRAPKVFVYNYGGRAADTWWQQNANNLSKYNNLSVFALPEKQTQALTAICDRVMQLYCTIQDSQVWIATREKTLQIEPKVRKLAIT